MFMGHFLFEPSRGFEPPMDYSSPVYKTGAINHYATKAIYKERFLELKMRFELMTSSVPRKCTTTVQYQQFIFLLQENINLFGYMMGFEPTLFACAHSASQADSFDHARTTHTMFIFFYQENINLLGNR